MIFKKNNPTLAGLAILLTFPLFSQTLPAGMVTDWSKAGLINAPLSVFDTVNIMGHGLMPDGITSNNSALENLMAMHSGSPTVFYFPPGNYFFDKTVELNNNQVIKGSSSEETIFTFNLNGQNHLMTAKGSVFNLVKNITAGQPGGLNHISVDNTNGLQVGDFVRIQFDDLSLVTSNWAEKSTGQVLKIINIQGNLITTSDLIRRAIFLSENPYIEKINPVQYAGVECLHIERQDATTAQTSNIYFQYTANCWVKGVHSHNANFAHIDIENGSHNQITGCYFKDAFAYGGGGQGYGVALEFNTSDCLVDNNVFDHLRHSILLQAGANGNVIGYNYSINPYWTEVGLPEDAAGDLVLHGNYPYLNLFEGNIVQNIVIDDSHGSNGPGNVFFRNRAEHYGIFMNNDIPTDNQAFIGNEITSSNFLLGYYALAGSGHFEYGNNIKGNIVPTGTNAIIFNSLYLTEAPGYFKEINLDIPTIGPPNSLNVGSNPAKTRFLEGRLTKCFIGGPVVINNNIENVPTDLHWNIFPNPVHDILNIEGGLVLENYSLTILDLNGKVYFNKNNAVPKIDISGLNNGLYILVLENEHERFYKKINIVK